MRSRIELGPDGAPRARDAVRAVLTGRPPEVVDTAVLLASELVANALVHAADEATLVIELDEQWLHLEVIDPAPVVNLAPLDVGVDAERGRGLRIVDSLATEWGVAPRPSGKTVWCKLAI